MVGSSRRGLRGAWPSESHSHSPSPLWTPLRGQNTDVSQASHRRAGLALYLDTEQPVYRDRCGCPKERLCLHITRRAVAEGRAFTVRRGFSSDLIVPVSKALGWVGLLEYLVCKATRNTQHADEYRRTGYQCKRNADCPR